MKDKTFPLIYIEWIDAISNNTSWLSEEEILKWTDTTDWVIQQTGFLIKETKEYMLIASRINPQEHGIKNLDGCIKIPKTWIRKRVVLKEI
jgi:hypothetical protein